MSESLTHNELVHKIVKYVSTMCPDEYREQIKADLPEFQKPNMTYNDFVPDVMYCCKGKLIIGEAKTTDDFNAEHSFKQFESYMKECKNYPHDSYIIIGVPWEIFITAKNHFKLLKRKYDSDVNVVVLATDGSEASL